MADAPKQNLQTTAIIAKLFELDERRVQQLSCLSAIVALLCLRSASASSLSASAFAVSAVLASLPFAFSRRCFMYALTVGSRSNLYGRVDAAGSTPDFASCCTRRSSSSKSFAIIAVVCRVTTCKRGLNTISSRP